MATVAKHQITVPISVTGEVTGETLSGKFVFKTRLSHRERLAIDILRRQNLGPQPEGAIPSAQAMASAQILANLEMRVIDAPSWWTNSANGQDLADEDVIIAVYNAALKAESDAISAIRKDADDAKKDLEQAEQNKAE